MGGEEKKDEVVKDETELEQETQESPGEEYDKGWDEAEEVLEPGSGKPKTDDDTKAEEKKAEEKPAEKKPVEDTKKTAEPDLSKSGSELGLKGTDAALHDTKRWATKLAQDNANLKKALAEKDSSEKAEKVKKATEASKAAQERLNMSVQDAVKEYPELKGPLEGLMAELDTTKKQLAGMVEAQETQTKAQEKLKAEQKYFEDNIKPQIVTAHPDFDAIVNSPGKELFVWAEKQSPAIQFAVFQSSDPADISLALDRFKADKSSGYIKEARNTDTKLKDTKLKNAQALRGGSQIPEGVDLQRSGSGKADDYDGGWEAADALLKKEGIS